MIHSIDMIHYKILNILHTFILLHIPTSFIQYTFLFNVRHFLLRGKIVQ